MAGRGRRGTTSRLERIKDVVGAALARTGLDRDLDDYRIMEVWDQVVGPAIARNAQPTRLDDRRLVVTVRNSTWLHELGLLRNDLCMRLNEHMGRKVINELFIVVGRLDRAPVQTKKPASDSQKPQLHPLPDLSDSGLGGELAEAFERLWRASHERHRS